MCGVLAFFSNDGAAEAFVDPIAAALEQLHHRGPDDTKVTLVDHDAVLAHKRLSIIDVAGSQEPLAYLDGRYLLIFNGEIYNYVELRKQLAEDCEATFATCGDAEVIAAGYHVWGEAVVHRLRGMFAFVIWDRLQRRVFAARDEFGIKPLYVLQTGEGVFLASEKKALLPFAASAYRGDDGIDTASLSHYLTFQYVPETATLHRGISRLGSGAWLTWQPNGQPHHGAKVTIRRWWQPAFTPTAVDDPHTLYTRIRAALRDSVRAHLQADVPVGAFLSSGIDSTAVVALAREIDPNIMTFTVGYDMPGYSEIDVAAQSARHLEVTTVPTMIDAQDMMDALPKIVWHLDDPVADPSLVPLYFVAKKAAEYVTVVLSGEGADELFAGYRIYREPMSLGAVQNMSDPMQRGLRALSKAIPYGMKGKSFLERGTTPIEERYYGNARIFTEADKRLLMLGYDPSVRYTDVTGPLYAECADLDDVTKMQYIDLLTWLRGDILVKADRISMAHSLEVRVPFLDKQIFAIAATLPVEMKLPSHSDVTKHALRQALADVVPSAIVNRPKLGFPTPIRVWLRQEMYEWARHILATSGAATLLDLSYAMRLLDDHKRGTTDHSRRIWTVLIFCLWHAIFVERSLDPGITRNPSALLSKPPLPRESKI
jgi:asparagine synthase (glutamine-hydrolysing)